MKHFSGGCMKGRVTFAAVASIAALSLGGLWVSQRAGHAIVQPAAAATAAAGHSAAEEHVKMMAAMGDVHAGHAMEELAWPPMQAAPNNLTLPADAEGAKARLASSPRKGEYVKI